LVGDATRRATAAAIAYEPAGEHELKGKTEPISLFRALRVTAVRGGARTSSELEPPFVGRARELRLVKEHFHGAAEERKAHLVSRICSDSRSTHPATGKTSFPRGGSSSNAWRNGAPSCSFSKTCSGPTRPCSTSSSTYSSGRTRTRSSCSRSRGRSSPSAGQ